MNRHSNKLKYGIIAALLIAIAFSSVILYHLQQQMARMAEADQPKSNEMRVYGYSNSDFLEQDFRALFHESGLDLEAKIYAYPNEFYYDICSVNLTSDHHPDLIMIEHPAVIDQYIPSSGLVNLENHMQQSWRSKLEVFRQENAQYLSPPLRIDFYTLFYNDELVKSWGFSLSSPQFADILALCAAAEKEGVCPLALGSRSIIGIRSAMIQLCTTAVANAQFDNAWAKFSELIPFLPPHISHIDENDARVLFMNGNACLYFGLRSEGPFLEQNSSFAIGQTHLCDAGKQFVWYDYTGMFAINQFSHNKISAMEFLKQLSFMNATDTPHRFLENLYSPRTGRSSLMPNWLYAEGAEPLKRYMDQILYIQANIGLFPLKDIPHIP